MCKQQYLATHSPGDTPPPQGAPWDLPLHEVPFCFLDLEMTGLVPGVDRIVEVCVERVQGEALQARVETLINPEGKRGAEEIHGLSHEELSHAAPFAEVAARIHEILQGGVIVAHGASHDLAFLSHELGRAGHVTPTHAIDTVILARRAFHLQSYSLQNVAAALGVLVPRAHRAGVDVATLRAIWPQVIRPLDASSPRDLWEVRVAERTPRPAIVSAFDQALKAGSPISFCYRPAHRSPEELTMVPTALVPPHAIGYLLPGRGRREVRMDRILRIVQPSPLLDPSAPQALQHQADQTAGQAASQARSKPHKG